MIFFHHTHACHWQNNIKTVGLIGHRLDWPDLADRCGVWLTTEPQWIGRDIRITLAIGQHDRRLIHVEKLLRKRLQPWELAAMDGIAVQAAQADWRTFWLYAGDIALDRFVTVEAAHGNIKTLKAS